MLQSQSHVFSHWLKKSHLFFRIVCTLPIRNHLVRSTWGLFRCTVSFVSTSLPTQHSCLREAGAKFSLYLPRNSVWHRWVPTSDCMTVPGSHTRTEMSYREQPAHSVQRTKKQTKNIGLSVKCYTLHDKGTRNRAAHLVNDRLATYSFHHDRNVICKCGSVTQFKT